MLSTAALQDLDQLLMFYPYLKGPFNYDCAADQHEQNRAPYSPGPGCGVRSGSLQVVHLSVGYALTCPTMHSGHDGAGDWDKEDTYEAQLRKERGEPEVPDRRALCVAGLPPCMQHTSRPPPARLAVLLQLLI
jgi:hypothetical protein